jgi:membrane complex biogenesis BtpA family protein
LSGRRDLILVTHLPPTPGSPSYTLTQPLEPEEAVELALREARAAEEAGYTGVIVENYGDAPYSPRPHPGAVALVAIAAREVARATSLEVGVSLLRNAPREAIQAAAAAGARLVRVNALCAPRLTPEGLIGPSLREAAEALALLGPLASRIELIADVDVKHGLPASPGYSVEWEVGECASRRGPLPLRGVAVTGARTGEPPSLEYLSRASQAARRVGLRVYLASGATPGLVGRAKRLIDGVIVGSYVRRGGRAGAPLDPARLEELARALREP